MGGGDGLLIVPDAGRVLAPPVAHVRDHPGLVDRDEPLYPVAEGRRHQAGVVGEQLRRVAGRPAALVLQRLGQVPVMQRDHRRDPALQQRVDEPAVVGQAGRVRSAAALGLDARPGDGEPVGAGRQPGDQSHIVRGPVVAVAGDVTSVAVHGLPGLVAERIPHRGALPVLGRRALDLVGRRGHPPHEPRRELIPLLAVRWTHPVLLVALGLLPVAAVDTAYQIFAGRKPRRSGRG